MSRAADVLAILILTLVALMLLGLFALLAWKVPTAAAIIGGSIATGVGTAWALTHAIDRGWL